MREEKDHKGTLMGLAAVIVAIGGLGGLITILVNLGFVKPPFASPTTSPYSIQTPIPQLPSNTLIPQSPSNTPAPRSPIPTTAVPTGNKNPNKPSNVSPATNTSFQLGTAPALCVQHNGDPDGDAITVYKFKVTDGNSIKYESDWTTSSCATLPTSFVTSAGAYYWHAKVRDARGGESDWGPTWNIPVLAANRNPNVPSLVSPTTNTGFLLGAAIRLCGQHKGDPDGDSITSYQFIVSGQKNWDSGKITNNCVDVQASAVNSKGTYYWLMRVYDSRSGTTSSSTWYFVIK